MPIGQTVLSSSPIIQSNMLFITKVRNSAMAIPIGAAFLSSIGSNFCDKKIALADSRPITNKIRNKDVSMKEKVVLITGATAGIGSACAWKFAEAGSKLVLIGRRNDRLSFLKQEILGEYPNTKIHTVALSVTDYESVSALPSQLPTEFQSVEILINNAGLALGVTSVDNNNVADAIEVINTNVMGTVAICSAFLPTMLQRQAGHIINMGSVAVRF